MTNIHDNGQAAFGHHNKLAVLPTPLLALDLTALDANIVALAGRTRDFGIGLRPHAKVHKSVEIATRQVAAGAVGVCVSTVSEAEAMLEGGIRSVLLTTPIADVGKAARMCELARTFPDVKCVADSHGQVAFLAAQAQRRRTQLSVLVDIDVGRHRTGIQTVTEVLALAREITAADGLVLGGVQAYAGQIQHVSEYKERRGLAIDVSKVVARTTAALAEVGSSAAVVTGSGTGSHDIDRHLGVYTDLQAGSYIFPDVFYSRTPLTAAVDDPVFRPALTVWTRVISNNQDGLMITDGGFKCMGPADIAPRVISGAPEGSAYRFQGAEHGSIVLPPSAPKLQLGTLVQCLPPYADATVHLFRNYTVLRPDGDLELWPVRARGYA